MTTNNKPVYDRKQPFRENIDEKRIENGHLRWSPWTQRRLLHIGAPIAGLFAMIMPLALYATSGTDLVAMPSNTPSSSSAGLQNKNDSKIDNNYSYISSQSESSSGSTNTHTTSLVVNGRAISVPENATKTTINDVSGTTSVQTRSTTTEKTDGNSTQNISTLSIDINHNRGP